MRRGTKPSKAKVESKHLAAAKSRDSEGSRVRDLEKRLAEALEREAEALEQQAATAEILQVISGSPTDVQPVFDTIVRSAVRLCNGLYGFMGRFDGELIHLAAHHNYTPDALRTAQQMYPLRPSREQLSGRTILTRAVVHVADALADPEYAQHLARAAGWRSMLGVPLMRDGSPIGMIGVLRDHPGPFSDKQIALLQTFADQAVIAIENVRLFTELQEKNRALTEAHEQVTEALEQQTATSEILRVISRSPTDVQPTFDAIARSARRLCDAAHGMVFRFDGELIHLAAHDNLEPEQLEAVRRVFPIPPSRRSVTAQAILTGSLVHVRDRHDDPELDYDILSANFPTTLAVPLLRDRIPLGAITVTRAEAKLFSDREIELLKTFADQAVIAIENVRLFNETKETLEQQTATSDILSVISRSPTDVQPVFDAVAESAARLCESFDSAIWREEGDQLRLVAHHGAIPQTGSESFLPLIPSTVGGRSVLDGRTVHIADVQTEGDEFSTTSKNARRQGFRTILSVPLMREGVATGAIILRRTEAQPFTERQVALLQTFADQAVIAIENVRLFKELEAANRELAAASQHKSEFLANMSHELRTPLNAIIGFSEVLSEKMFGELNEKQEEYSKDIHASGQHLLSLINDILDLSKIEAGRMELEVTDFDLPMTIDNAMTLIRERAARRSIVLNTAVDERLGQIRADERKIRQVLLNLLSNAIKFTPEGGTIEVGAKPLDGSIEVSVTDTGVGIAPEDQEAVFEEFRQVGTAERKVEGTGLGLALSRKFIELHGGKIWVKSQVGEGSTFTFTVPVRRGE